MKFKDDVVKDRFNDMHSRAQEVATFMDNFTNENYGVELTITATVSTFEEDKSLGRVSDTHRTGRAFDIRLKDLDEGVVAELCAATRKKFKNLGAIVKGTPSLIVLKPHGTAPHLHVQLSRKYIKFS